MKALLVVLAISLVGCEPDYADSERLSPNAACPEWIFSHEIELPDDGNCWQFRVVGTLDVSFNAPEIGCPLPSYGCGGIGRGQRVEVWERPFRSDGASMSVFLESCEQP
jgi:hypothetical protein